MTILLAGLGRALPAEPDANDDPPKFLAMGCVEEAKGQGEGAEGLEMECRGTPPYSTIDCNFTSIIVLGPDSERTKKSRAELIADATKQSAAQRERLITDGCETAKKLEGMLPEGRGTLSVRRMQQRGLDRARQLCACRGQGAPCLTAVMLRVIDDEERTCSIQLDHFESRFVKVSEDRWMHSPGPEGVCDVVNVEILEREPNHPSLWTYKLRPTVGNPGASPLCKVLAPKECSWRLPSAAAVQCETLKFGF